jgi:hypothetical protein
MASNDNSMERTSPAAKEERCEIKSNSVRWWTHRRDLNEATQELLGWDEDLKQGPRRRRCEDQPNIVIGEH